MEQHARHVVARFQKGLIQFALAGLLGKFLQLADETQPGGAGIAERCAESQQRLQAARQFPRANKHARHKTDQILGNGLGQVVVIVAPFQAFADQGAQHCRQDSDQRHVARQPHDRHRILEIGALDRIDRQVQGGAEVRVEVREKAQGRAATLHLGQVFRLAFALGVDHCLVGQAHGTVGVHCSVVAGVGGIGQRLFIRPQPGRIVHQHLHFLDHHEEAGFHPLLPGRLGRGQAVVYIRNFTVQGARTVAHELRQRVDFLGLAHHMDAAAVEFFDAAPHPARTDTRDGLRDAQRLLQRRHQRPAHGRDGGTDADMVQAGFDCISSRFVTDGDVFDRCLDGRYGFSAVAGAHGAVQAFEQLVGVDQPFMPGQVVDHLVGTTEDAVEGQQQGATLDRFGTGLGEAAARGGGGVRRAHLRLGGFGLVVRPRLARLVRVVLDRVIPPAQGRFLAISGLDGDGRRLDPFRFFTVDAALFGGDLGAIGFEEVPHALHELPLFEGQRFQHRLDLFDRPAAAIQ